MDDEENDAVELPEIDEISADTPKSSARRPAKRTAFKSRKMMGSTTYR